MIIAVVGAGGKTTKIHQLAEQYRRAGKRVLITTTTHMEPEEGTLLTDDAEEICNCLKEKGSCMAGTFDGKLAALSKETFQKAAACADITLVEADGSKRLPAKIPADWEPVIPEGTDQIIVVMGLKALGKPAGEVCHRMELVEKQLGITAGEIICPEHLQQMILEGYVKPLGETYPGIPVTVAPGQADTLYERVLAEFLAEEKPVNGIEKAWFDPQPKLVICGGGHVAAQVAVLGKMLDFSVQVMDDRPEFANAERFPGIDEICCHPFERAEEIFPKEENVYYVVATRGHQADRICVEQILRRNYAYLGMIGSRRKVAGTFAALKEAGFPPEKVEEIHAPIGLAIQAQTPAEIAVSIMAEIIAEKNKKSYSTLSRELADTTESGVLCIIVEKTGSSPRNVGSMMLVKKDGSTLGSIGGGAVEYEAIQYAAQVTEICEQTYDLSNRESASLGMICGGTNRIVFVPIRECLC